MGFAGLLSPATAEAAVTENFVMSNRETNKANTRVSTLRYAANEQVL
jgi:hypothetical protein